MSCTFDKLCSFRFHRVVAPIAFEELCDFDFDVLLRPYNEASEKYQNLNWDMIFGKLNVRPWANEYLCPIPGLGNDAITPATPATATPTTLTAMAAVGAAADTAAATHVADTAADDGSGALGLYTALDPALSVTDTADVDAASMTWEGATAQGMVGWCKLKHGCKVKHGLRALGF